MGNKHAKITKKSSSINRTGTFSIIPVPPENVNKKECEDFLIKVKKGRVVKVYDIDTVTVAFFMSINGSEYKLYKKSCRILGIDGPELKSKIKSEKKIAKLGQIYLKNLILGKVITLNNHHKDKYGRMLADIYLNGIKVSDLILSNKYAVEYDGGTKKSPENWEHFHEQ